MTSNCSSTLIHTPGNSLWLHIVPYQIKHHKDTSEPTPCTSDLNVMLSNESASINRLLKAKSTFYPTQHKGPDIGISFNSNITQAERQTLQDNSNLVIKNADKGEGKSSKTEQIISQKRIGFFTTPTSTLPWNLTHPMNSNRNMQTLLLKPN